MKSLCVFCGSSPGNRPAYASLAVRTGELIARRGVTLVYGGGRVGLHTAQNRVQAGHLMGDLADAFLALPGGIGTMDELFEAWTWTQLDLHRKPCALLNQDGYYDPLLEFLDRAVAEGFLEPRYRAALLVDADVETALDRLAGAVS